MINKAKHSLTFLEGNTQSESFLLLIFCTAPQGWKRQPCNPQMGIRGNICKIFKTALKWKVNLISFYKCNVQSVKNAILSIFLLS